MGEKMVPLAYASSWSLNGCGNTCPTCQTWSYFVQDKLAMSPNMLLFKFQIILFHGRINNCEFKY